MTRAQMRTLLRRRINDVGGGQWSDAELNDLLNIGIAEVQKGVLAVDPDANLYRSRVSIVANQQLYAIPDNLLHERAVKKKDATTGTYRRMERITFERAMEKAESADAVTSNASEQTFEWFRFGQFIGLSPTPTESQTDGVELDFVPLLSVGSDSEIPPVPLSLHYAVVLRAEIAAKGETTEGIETALAEFQGLVAGIPSWYMTNAGRTMPAFYPDMDKGY